MLDAITIIRSRHLLLAKRIHSDGRIQDYDDARVFDLSERPVDGLDAIHEVLKELIRQPQCAAVFGGIIDPARISGVRRLAYPDLKTGDQPTLRPVQHRWVALDVDGVDRPDYIEAEDLFSCGAWATQRLPEAFRGARCLVQASAGHGIKSGCRLRLWFWLDRPVTGNECEHWCKGYPIDLCTFRTAQPIFTAAPVFVGRKDHLPARVLELFGAPEVRVPPPEALRPPERPRPAVSAGPRVPVSDEHIQQFVDRALDRVRHAPEHHKHYVLRDNARLLGGIADQAGLSDVYLTGLLLDALPSTVVDWAGARDTAEWGLAVGREQPIDLATQANPSRSETAKRAFRLLRCGMPGAEVLRQLHEHNQTLPDPLPAGVVEDTALWCAQNLQVIRDAA